MRAQFKETRKFESSYEVLSPTTLRNRKNHLNKNDFEVGVRNLEIANLKDRSHVNQKA